VLRQGGSQVSGRDEMIVPIVEERAVISKREIPVERVRVRTAVEAREELVSGDLRTEALEIERRPVERPVSEAPAVREEGDATIISIVEERAVITKQLFVVEELVVRRRATAERFDIPVSLRRTTARVEHEALSDQQENH
jgi:stress response protein YsnF